MLKINVQQSCLILVFLGAKLFLHPSCAACTVKLNGFLPYPPGITRVLHVPKLEVGEMGMSICEVFLIHIFNAGHCNAGKY